jgi:hypothetical protein
VIPFVRAKEKVAAEQQLRFSVSRFFCAFVGWKSLITMYCNGVGANTEVPTSKKFALRPPPIAPTIWRVPFARTHNHHYSNLKPITIPSLCAIWSPPTIISHHTVPRGFRSRHSPTVTSLIPTQLASNNRPSFHPCDWLHR